MNKERYYNYLEFKIESAIMGKAVNPVIAPFK